MEMLELIKEYIRPELMILIPVLYLLGVAGKKNKYFKDKWIPVVLGAISIFLTGLYVFATTDIHSVKEAIMLIFTTITQGVLLSGTAVYANQIYKQIKENWGGFKMEIIKLPDVISDTELVYEEVEEDVEWWRLKNLLLKLN